MSHIFRFHGRRTAPYEWILSPEEWHHMLKVLRLEANSPLELADGAGWVAHASLKAGGRTEGRIVVSAESFEEARSPDRSLVLALGAVKPQSVDDILPSIIELGIDAIWVFPFAGMARSRLSEKVRDRWERVVASSAKQCKRAWWPEVVWLESFDEFLERSGAFAQRLVLDADATMLLSDWHPLSGGRTLAAVGSEKGLSPDELFAMSQKGFQSLRLQGSILRAITASIATTALLRHHPNLR